MSSTNPLERTVHGMTADGAEIVRYDRAGKWRVEHSDGRSRAITVKQAAELAAELGGVAWKRYGGTRFWSEYRKVIAKPLIVNPQATK